MPDINDTAGLAEADEIVGKYVTLVTVDDGVITVTYGGAAHNIIRGATLQLSPVTVNVGAVGWTCSSAAASIANKHLPAACRSLAP